MDDDLKIFVLDSKHALVIGFDGSELINRYPLILTGFNTRRRWNPVVEKTDKTTSVYDFQPFQERVIFSRWNIILEATHREF